MVFLDEDDIVNQMARAAANRSKICCDGPVVIEYHPSSQAHADFMVKGTAFGMKVGPEGGEFPAVPFTSSDLRR